MEESIIRTLSYFDIFDFPPSFLEIKKYMDMKIDISDEDLEDIILSISTIQESRGYYYFLGRREIVDKRVDRNEISARKMLKAKIIANILSLIPTIEYIGVSGSLSMNNAKISDDIDLFFITKKNTLWLSRFLVNVVLLILRQKRDRYNANVQDKICPNMFMEKGKLSFSKKRKTLYIAHEIVQLKTLFDRNNSHKMFLNSNKWVKNFFPNMIFSEGMQKRETDIFNAFLKLVIPLEGILFFVQKAYMKKRISNETINFRRASFHPIDRQKIVLELHNLRINRYHSLYNDNMWIDREEARFYIEEKKIRILN